MAFYAGIDLHSNNGYYAIVDEKGRRVFRKRLPNELRVVLEALAPFQGELEGVAVESTYNWYWLVDGLMDHGYLVHLANPAAIGRYSGLKDTNDETDAFFLAEQLRLGILPEGYIYPKADPPAADPWHGIQGGPVLIIPDYTPSRPQT
jgi:transposase